MVTALDVRGSNMNGSLPRPYRLLQLPPLMCERSVSCIYCEHRRSPNLKASCKRRQLATASSPRMLPSNWASK